MSLKALKILQNLRLEDGERWGSKAIPHQLADATAVFEDQRPHLHFLTRPRGGSKSTDIAGVAISWLMADSRKLSHGYVVASNATQAAIVIDAAASYRVQTPELSDWINVESEKIIGVNGASVRVLPLSDAGSWGLRDAHLLICDEFAQWPETRAAKRVYSAIRSTVQKVSGCRLVILTSAGEPSHWSHEIFQSAKQEMELAKAQKRPSLWRVSEMPGPVPWQDPVDIEALRQELLPSAYDRLVLNIWSEDEDRAIHPEDYDNAALPCDVVGSAPSGLQGHGLRLRGPELGIRYIVTVDVGVKNDATVMCVAHPEPLDEANPKGPQRVVVDHLERWVGSKKRPVRLREVEQRLVQLTKEYNQADIHADPDQFVGSIQNLNMMGVFAKEWRFTATSVGQVATALVQAFHNKQILIPDHRSLREELLRVRLRESAPGVTRLDHERGAHDDQAVCIGMACHLLLSGARPSAIWLQAVRKMIEADAKAKPTPFSHLLRPLFGADEHEIPSSCRSPRYFGPEELCVHCGKSPADHAEALNGIAAYSAPSRATR